MQNKNNNSNGVGKILGAAALGTAAGVLLAPKKGEDTRKDIKNKANELMDGAKQQGDMAMTKASDAVSSVKDTALNKKDEFVSKAENVKDALEKETKKTKNNLEKSRTKVKESAK